MPTTTGDLEDWLDAVLDDARPGLSKSARLAFERYAIQQEMSKRGRFYRVHFKTGVVLDFVPKGSIAMGRALTRDEVTSEDDHGRQGPTWRFVYPPLGVLWHEFEGGIRLQVGRKRRKVTKG